MNPSDYHLPPSCPRSWQSLATTPDSAVRYCDDCASTVHWVATPAELVAQAKAGRCVAMAASEPDADMPPDMLWLGFPEGMKYYRLVLTIQRLNARQTYWLFTEIWMRTKPLPEIQHKAARQEIILRDDIHFDEAEKLLGILTELGIQARIESYIPGEY